MRRSFHDLSHSNIGFYRQSRFCGSWLLCADKGVVLFSYSRDEVFRPLTAHEEIYWRLSYNDQIHVVCAAEVEGRRSIDEWRAAVGGLQGTSPLLSVSISIPRRDNELRQPIFVTHPNAPIPLRIVEEERFDLGREIEAELAAPFLEGEAPLCRVVLAQRGDGAAVVLSVSHSIGDGTTAMVLMRDLLSRVGRVDGAPAPTVDTAQARLGVENIPPAGRVLEDGPIRSANAGRRPNVALHRLTAAETDLIAAGARAHGSTVHGALAAATVAALRQCSPAHAGTDVKIISPIDTRKRLGLPRDALGLYFASPQTTYAPDASDDFWATAERTRADIAVAAQPDALHAAAAGMQAYTQSGLTNASANESLDGVFAMDVLLTNLGRAPFDAEFGDLRLARLWGPIVLGGRDHVQTIGVTTLDGAMHLAHVSREPVPDLPRAIAETLLREAPASE